ncbi:hypothetical protein L0669_13375 [Flavobacterium bizetiae]|uniref:hypothetical protein n=1 Tax=Flavobacterium bizetiae TaxID=2704140 RepID=UPI0021E6F1F9|nr:hypothetical protein [Flavobacterium bizetiae]UTN02310.1 hypothetical protein L0669_13375 [Flavobacterium bizetiae]
MTTELIEIEDVLIFIHELSESGDNLILEAKIKGENFLVGPYSYSKHQRHNPTGEYHLHVYKKNNEIFSINQSGKGHDGYSGTAIPNKVFNELKIKFPTWNWPDSQIIESLLIAKGMNSRNHLRPVTVFPYQIELNQHDGFKGYFHTFADDPFLTGGNGGWKNKTIAIIESEDGHVRKVPVDKFKFIDIEN